MDTPAVPLRFHGPLTEPCYQLGTKKSNLPAHPVSAAEHTEWQLHGHIGQGSDSIYRGISVSLLQRCLTLRS